MYSVFEYGNFPNIRVFAILQPSFSFDVANTIIVLQKIAVDSKLIGGKNMFMQN
jgi:hypothetical protein